jgi:drug/metabolite transporter (DMT)-like permease
MYIGELIPIFGIVFTFLTMVLIIFIIFLYKTKQEKFKNEVLKTAIEQGRELPPDFFKLQQKPKGNLLRTSLFFLAFGIGLGIFFYFFFAPQGEGWKFASIGLIFIFVGIGQLIAYLIEQKQKKSGEQEGV